MQAEKSKRGMGWSRSVGQPVGVGWCGGMSFWVGVMWLQMMIGIGAWMVEAEEMRYELLDRRIEELMDSGQYQKAFAEYSTIDGVQLGEVPGYWLDYRKVDSHWRALGSTAQRDNGWMEKAEKDLTELLERTYPANPGIEYIKAYIHESLGELKMRRYGVWSRDSWLADILSAMDYWAGAEPDDSSRARYLALARRVIDPMGGGEMISSHMGMRQSGEVYRIIEGAYRIADGLDEKGYFGMALAGYYRWSGDAREVDKAFRVLDRISAEVDEGVWHWRILYTKAQMLMSPGIPRRNAQGTWEYEVDYVGMVGLLEELIRGDVDNSSGHVREAEELIKQTRSRQIMVHVDGIFLPGQKVVMDVVMRNAAKMDVRIVPLSFSNRLNLGTRGWTENGVSGIFSIPIKRPVYQAEIENEKFENHQAYTRKIEIEAGLAAGAYMVVAESGDQKIQELLLVTGAMGVSQVYSEGCSLLFADSISGKPLSGAQVKIVRGMRGQNSNMSFREYKFDVGESGILDLNKAKVDNLDQSEVLVLAETSHGPVVFQLYGMGARQSGLGSEAVKYYTFCDRPAYRPGDEVQWKVVVRRPDGGAYSVPAGMRVAYEIQSPRGDKVQEGHIDINNYGTGLGSLTLGQEATLGTYRILLKSKSDRYWVGNFPLFRLEEYKLPEFFVKVGVSGEGGGVSLPGEEIEMEVSAQYYYGAAVSGGEVEVIVKRRKWQYPWEKPMPYPWMAERGSSQLTYRGYMPGMEPSEEVYRTSLQTDALGRARFTFETEDLEMGVDYEYTVEARVTDGSRVMVAGQGAVKVSEKPYFVSGSPEHVIHVPGDSVKIQWSFRDANQRPVAVKGRIQVALQKTIEVEVNQRPDGRMVFPPAKDIYEYEIISMIDVETDGSGEYESLWRPEKKGFYRFKWIGDGVPAYLDPEYSVGVWVMGDDQETIGYRSGGVEIISDKKSVESGSEYTFVVAPAKPGGFVWLSYEVGNTWHDEIVPVEGNARVMKYKVGPEVSRNFFIHAVTVRDLHVYEDHEEVLVPPSEKILSMDIKPAEEVYRPGEQTEWTVTVLDSDGQPVMGELALSVYDKSIESIQKDYAGSIEGFFYSGKYFSVVSVNNMLSYKGYYIEPEDEDGRNNIQSADRIMPVSRKLMRGAMPTPMMAAVDSAVAGMVEEAGISSDPANDAAQPIVVRSNFRKTAFWDGQIITDQNGQARVSFVLPDSLTAWKAVGRFVDKQTAVAQGESEVQARNPLNVRLELPRFLVSGDEAVLSAMVSNQTNEALDVAMDWELAGGWQPDSADHLHVAQKKSSQGSRFCMT
ncbi:MAG: MG2 domain-containing protein [Verrucomicrobia bacterium]|nr:MG2 domain-containing protein [Verrucomicrobiota bacterium]